VRGYVDEEGTAWLCKYDKHGNITDKVEDIFGFIGRSNNDYETKIKHLNGEITRLQEEIQELKK